MLSIKQQILKEIEKNKKEEIAFLQKLVRTPSVNHFVSEPEKSKIDEPIEKEVAKLIFQKLKKIGLSPKFEGISKERPNVIAILGKKGKTLIFNGHMDTIPPDPGYNFNHFSGKIENGKLWGVGALDMKSSLCAFIFSAKALLKFRDKVKGKLCLQFAVDEEPMAASKYGTRFLLEKGYGGDAAIVGEPGSHKITIGNKGGYRFRLKVYGEACHTGSREWEEKEKGKNAILEMTKAIKELQNFSFPDKDYLVFPGRKNIFTFPTMISGGKSVNMVPSFCEALGDVRILPKVTEKFIENQIKERLDKTGIKYKLEKIVYVPSVFTNKREALVQILNKNTKAILKEAPKIEGSGPWSDMWMFIEKGIPTVNFGCKGEGFHSKNEYVDLKNLIDVTKIYSLAALEFLNS